MASAAESELAALFITAREMIPHRQTLIAMWWPQPKTPIKTDNSTVAGVTNYQQNNCPPPGQNDGMRLWWLRCRGSQNSFDIIGMLDPNTGPITTPNITQTPTMKPTGQLMLVSGNRMAPKT
jgi:hypothetical protein